MANAQRDIAAEIEERHSGKLPTPEARAAYVARVTTAMEAGAQALLETVKALRADPDGMLKDAFSPNISGMHPKALAVLELTHFGNDPSRVEVRGRTIIDGSRIHEIGFRAFVMGDAVTIARDNRHG